ncbi:DUF4232 domain-containing protein [Streptomyces sp. NPDC049954]|uniref:DUF4232 domain-containing protein n=1 Tax=Streptomyces sp. NPDC049954 TaxID=3155779 RepID=UPI0034408FAC
MRRHLTSRRFALRTAAASLTALAGLSLTACSGAEDTVGKVKDSTYSSSVNTKSATPSADKPAASTQNTGAKDTGAQDTGAKDTGAKDTGAGETGAKAAAPVSHTQDVAAKPVGKADATQAPAAAAPAGKAAAAVTCTVANSKIRMSVPSRPINHLLLTLTNESGKRCYAYGAPYLGFDGDQSTAQWIEDSRPQAVVTLEPGEHAYASVLLSGDGDHGRQAKEMKLSMSGRAMAGSVGGLATTPVPGGSVHVDDDLAVSFWQTDAASALTW